MKIGLDAFSAIGKGGNSRYSDQLIRHLLRQGGGNRYYLFEYVHDLFRSMFNEGKSRTYSEVHTRLSPSYFPLPNLERINESLLRTGARLHGVDIFHFTNPLSVVAGPFKRVVTIHDLAAFHDPSWTKEKAGDLFRQKANLMMSSDALIAVSESTKADIVRKFGVNPEKITVVYEGAAEGFFPDDDPDATRAIVGAETYLLCAGQLQPRKNNLNLIRAFGRIAPRFPGLKLVFVGRAVNDAYVRQLHDAARGAGVGGSVVFAHAIDDAGLRKLYTRAACLVYPSLFEGFGLPVLESFQCGTPVITSNTSSLPEVAGEAGILVDPHIPESIAAAMEAFLANETLRQRLRAAIPAQLRKFSWERAARETRDVYGSCA